LGVMVSANAYLGLPTLAYVAIRWAIRAARKPQLSTGYPPQPPYPLLYVVPPPQTMPRRHAPQAHLRPARVPRVPARPAQTPVYWGRTVVGWADESGNVHIDRRHA